MRVLFGIIVGVALTVGVAFISDNWTTAPATTGSGTTLEHRNHGQLGCGRRKHAHRCAERAHETWTSLSHKVAS